MGTREILLRFVDEGSTAVNNRVDFSRDDGATNKVGVNLVFCVVIIRARNFAVDKIRLNVRDKGGLKSLLHDTRTSWGGDGLMQRVLLPKAASQVLG